MDGIYLSILAGPDNPGIKNQGYIYKVLQCQFKKPAADLMAPVSLLLHVCVAAIIRQSETKCLRMFTSVKICLPS